MDETGNNTNFLDRLFTPKQLADRRIMSLVTQWKNRNNGLLKFYQVGTKIFYEERHIQAFFSLCEKEDQKHNRLGKRTSKRGMYQNLLAESEIVAQRFPKK